LIIFGSIMNLPESPRWLVMQGKDEEAMEVLSYINDKPQDDPQLLTEFQEVKATVEEMSKGSFRSLFVMTDYREFHRVVLAYVNQMFQQISGKSCFEVTWSLSSFIDIAAGINLITYYAPTLYGQVGLSSGQLPKLLAACNGTEYLIAAFIPIFIIEKVGRRPLMLIGVSAIHCNWVCT